MNKLFSKIATLSVGLAMAIGVGVAVNSNRSVLPLNATAADLSDWTKSGTGTYADGSIKFDGSGDYILKNGLFSGEVTSLTVTVNCKSNSGPAAGNVYTASALSSSGSSIADLTKSGSDISTSYSDMVFSFTSGISSATGIKLTYTTKATGGGNWGIKSVNYEYTTSGGVTTYTVTYNSNGGTGTLTDSNSPYESGANVTVLNNTFTAPEDKEFDKWNTAANGSGTDYNPNDVFSITSNVTLYAQWKDVPSGDQYVLTLSNSGVSGSNYNNGAERTTTIDDVGFGSKATIANSGRIQLQGSNGIIYNTTAFPAPIASVTMVQEGTNRAMTLQAGSSSRLVNDTTGDYSISGGSTTGITAPSTAATMKWTFAANTSYTFFALKVGATNATYVASVTVKLQDINETTTVLSVSPNSWTGYDSQTINVSDYTISCTTSASDDGYIFQGIGSGADANFVARVSNFTSGNPTTSDTRLQWKAKYPTTLGGSTYLYAYVSLNVTADSVSSLSVSGSMSKTDYHVGEQWNPSGLTVNAYYASAPSTPVDVTSSVSWTYNPASPALNVTSVVATASFGGKSANSNAQSVTVTKANPIQQLYTTAELTDVDVRGYYAGFLTGTGPVIMDGEYGVVIYARDHDASSYTVNETVLHVTAKLTIFNGLYELGGKKGQTTYTPTIVVETDQSMIDEVNTPVVYAVKGGETQEFESRSTTVTGKVISAEPRTSGNAKWTSDTNVHLNVNGNDILCFCKANALTTDQGAEIEAALTSQEEITLKGFTGWYNSFQVTVNGIVEAVVTYTAEDFAEDLLDQTHDLCAAYVDGSSDYNYYKAELTAIWSDLASADKYPSLPNDQKTILAEAERDESGTTVEQAMARYDFLTGKYELNNFINGRTPMSILRVHNEITTDNNNVMIIIIAISITSVLATSILLAIKKRKHN